MKKDREDFWSIKPGDVPKCLILNEAVLEDISCSFSVYTKLPRPENSFFLTLPELESGMVFSIAPSPGLTWEFTGFDYGSLCITVRAEDLCGKTRLPAGSRKLPRRTSPPEKSSTGRQLCAIHCIYRL